VSRVRVHSSFGKIQGRSQEFDLKKSGIMMILMAFLSSLIRQASLPEKANLHRIEAIRRSQMSLHEKTNPISDN